jgi:hypothetical protein
MITSETIEQLRQIHQKNCQWPRTSQLREDFNKVLEIFIESNYGKGLESNSLMCSIHDSFPSHHSCIACNLNENARLIERFLLYPDSHDDLQYACTTLLMLLYLLVERIYEYFSLAKLPDSYRQRHFQVFQEVKHWANFLKHPKSFMLVTHPIWGYEGMQEPNFWGEATPNRVEIDTAFVKEYYRSDANNIKLYKLLARKDDIFVSFPNPVTLMQRFAKAQEKFVAVIAENEMVREMLESETMRKEHFAVEVAETIEQN